MERVSRICFCIPLALAAVAGLALTGCLTTGSTTCGDGRICPPNTRCDSVSHHCVTSADIAACLGHNDGEPCTVENTPGTCHSGVCQAHYCGDNVKSETESCDGSDLGGHVCADLGYYRQTSGLKCAPDCTFDTSGCEGKCGDGIINGTESCDGTELGGADCRSQGFYQADGLRCSPACKFDTSACQGRCGDRQVNVGEQCDGAPSLSCLDQGFDRGFTGCSALCAADTSGCAPLGWKPFQVDATAPFNAIWGNGPADIFRRRECWQDGLVGWVDMDRHTQ